MHEEKSKSKKQKKAQKITMSYYSRINKAFDGALRLPLNENSKYVIFSDCHRGTGSANDNFLKNEGLYLAALKHYFEKGFTYIELGDGDELWENRSFEEIKNMHPQSFAILSQYFKDKRFYSVYGNHDIIKKQKAFCDRHFGNFYCDHSLCNKPLFPNIVFYQGIILEDSEEKNEIYLTHGHQADFLNSTLWALSRFLVRYVWRPLELIGIPDPTSAAQNNTKKKKTEERLTLWAKQNNHILITGHTHRPMTGSPEAPYYNTGSCVSPSGVTCIEIENKRITLVKWEIGTKDTLSLYVTRRPLG